MLSDEERMAIEHLKNYPINWLIENVNESAIKIVLNLIEKQSKEIEHQKEKRENQKKELAILNAKQIEFNKLVNTVNSYKGQFKRQQKNKEIEELKVKNKTQSDCAEPIERTEEMVNMRWVNHNYILKSESEQKERKAYIKGTNDAHELCNKKWEDKIKAEIEEVCESTIEESNVDILYSLLEKE